MEEMKFKAAIDFLKSLGENDTIVNAMDSDADGVSAGTLISLYLDEKSVPHINHFLGAIRRGYDWQIKNAVGAENAPQNVTHIIVSDATLDKGTYDWLAEKHIKILTIDHHVSKADPATEGSVYVNFPKNHNEGITTPSSSALAYYLTSNAGLTGNAKWVGLIGAYSDLCLEASLKYLNMDKDEEDSYLPNKQLAFPIAEIESMMSTTYVDPNVSETFLGILKDSVKQNNPFLLVLEKEGRAKKIFETEAAATGELRGWTKKIVARKDLDINTEKKFVMFKFNPKLNIKRWLVGQLRMLYPGYTICVALDSEKYWSLSFRGGRDRDLSVLVPKSIEGIPDSRGGGHPKASGATVPKEYLDKVIENFLALI